MHAITTLAAVAVAFVACAASAAEQDFWTPRFGEHGWQYDTHEDDFTGLRSLFFQKYSRDESSVLTIACASTGRNTMNFMLPGMNPTLAIPSLSGPEVSFRIDREPIEIENEGAEMYSGFHYVRISSPVLPLIYALGASERDGDVEWIGIRLRDGDDKATAIFELAGIWEVYNVFLERCGNLTEPE